MIQRWPTYQAETWWDGKGHMQKQPGKVIFLDFWNPRWPSNELYNNKLTMHITNIVK